MPGLINRFLPARPFVALSFEDWFFGPGVCSRIVFEEQDNMGMGMQG